MDQIQENELGMVQSGKEAGSKGIKSYITKESLVNVTAPRHRLTKGGKIQVEEDRTFSLLHTLL